MKTNLLFSVLMAGGLVLVGCGEKGSGNDETGASADGQGDDEESGAADANPDGEAGDDGDGDAGSGDEGPADSGDDDGGSDDEATTGIGFIENPDGGGVSIECDIWAQDCPGGEKCMPWANDGGSSWNATKCTPVGDSPGQPGDPCTVEGTGVSGIDSCDVGSMCWNVDPETNEGTCLAFCVGSEASPTCDDPSTTCSITNNGVLILCLPICDPLAQDCPGEGEACYGLGPDAFVCAPDASGTDGAIGDPCEYLNACDAGGNCVNPELVSGCQAAGCCSAWCDLEADDCVAPQQCLPWAEEGQALPGLENVGVCGIPM